MSKPFPSLRSLKGPLVTFLLVCSFFTTSLAFPLSVQAVATSVLPESTGDYFACDENDLQFQAFLQERSVMESVANYEGENLDGDAMTRDFLGCAIKLGQVKFWMIPYFVNYVLEFMINIAGVLVVLMIIIGGYYYIYGAVTDDKEKGKAIITYAIGGYVLVLSSWFIVNAILLAVSS